SHALDCKLSSSPRDIYPPHGRGSRSCRIEGSNSKFASRQRPPFVAIHDRKPLSHVGKNGCEFLRPLWPRPCVVQDGRKRLQCWAASGVNRTMRFATYRNL